LSADSPEFFCRKSHSRQRRINFHVGLMNSTGRTGYNSQFGFCVADERSGRLDGGELRRQFDGSARTAMKWGFSGVEEISGPKIGRSRTI
jgi:hypothetical protein